ncbi:MAG: hypothetical protein WBD24_06160 [Candidatus Omnitrophota bacterium]
MKTRRLVTLILSFVFLVAFSVLAPAEDTGILFSGLESRKDFARETADLISKAWKKWQDSILIDDVYVDGAQGVLYAGGVKGPVLTGKSILASLNRRGKSQDRINCVRAVAGAVENGMRLWQKGYTHKNIPFPRGASCMITLPPTNNVPVTVGSGWSAGDAAMEEDALYNYMLYRAPRQGEMVNAVLRASAKAISKSFSEWKRSCSIVGIVASGGIAPGPAPMGPGPGMVRGAKGNGGKLAGAYIDGDLMYETMVEYFRQQKQDSR